jgi:transcriptional regulator with XRE-family HTH domain
MITPEQSRAARAWLEWSQEDLAQRAGVALSTVRDFEKGNRVPIGNNLAAIEGALATGGVFPQSDAGEPSGIRFEHRIRERDTYKPMLELLDNVPEGFLTTSDLIEGLAFKLYPQGEDTAILENRSDTRFSQIVRNIVSHKDTAANPIHLGWVEYVKAKRGMRITTLGRKKLSDDSW